MADSPARVILQSSTHPRWFASSAADLQALLSDHLHCERKAAENALSLVRRYPHRGTSVAQLSRLAHEETSHVVQVAGLMARRGWTPRADMPNQYARALLATMPARGHIVNLGHGILPETPLESVQALIDVVHAEVLL